MIRTLKPFNLISLLILLIGIFLIAYGPRDKIGEQDSNFQVDQRPLKIVVVTCPQGWSNLIADFFESSFQWSGISLVPFDKIYPLQNELGICKTTTDGEFTGKLPDFARRLEADLIVWLKMDGHSRVKWSGLIYYVPDDVTMDVTLEGEDNIELAQKLVTEYLGGWGVKASYPHIKPLFSTSKAANLIYTESASLIKEEQFRVARSMLSRSNKTFDFKFVLAWLRLAYCEFELGNVQDAVHSLESCIVFLSQAENYPDKRDLAMLKLRVWRDLHDYYEANSQTAARRALIWEATATAEAEGFFQDYLYFLSLKAVYLAEVDGRLEHACRLVAALIEQKPSLDALPGLELALLKGSARVIHAASGFDEALPYLRRADELAARYNFSGERIELLLLMTELALTADSTNLEDLYDELVEARKQLEDTGTHKLTRVKLDLGVYRLMIALKKPLNLRAPEEPGWHIRNAGYVLHAVKMDILIAKALLEENDWEGVKRALTGSFRELEQYGAADAFTILDTLRQVAVNEGDTEKEWKMIQQRLALARARMNQIEVARALLLRGDYYLRSENHHLAELDFTGALASAPRSHDPLVQEASARLEKLYQRGKRLH